MLAKDQRAKSKAGRKQKKANDMLELCGSMAAVRGRYGPVSPTSAVISLLESRLELLEVRDSEHLFSFLFLYTNRFYKFKQKQENMKFL